MSSISHSQIEKKYGGEAITQTDKFFPPSEVSANYEHDSKRLEGKHIEHHQFIRTRSLSKVGNDGDIK